MAILEFISDFFKEGATIRLSAFIREGTVCFLEVKNRDQALHCLVNQLKQAEKIDNEHTFYEAILRREKIVSTGIGMGVAIPHAKLETYRQFFIAVGVQKMGTGIEWDSLDGTPVKLIFMIGGPADRQTEYLQILSALTTAIKDETLRQKIYEAQSEEKVLDLFDAY
ncbi:MAG: fructose PTS transporter subunit IIA [Chlamydiota bacterium]